LGPFEASRALSSAFPRDRAEFFTTEDTENTEKKILEEVSRLSRARVIFPNRNGSQALLLSVPPP
jgi:hypothetical protein